MPTLTPDEAYALVRDVSHRAVQLREEARRMTEARDQLIRALDGDEGIVRRRLAIAAGVSPQRVTQMCNDESPEGIDEGVQVPPALRRALEEVRPDLGRVRKIATRVA